MNSTSVIKSPDFQNQELISIMKKLSETWGLGVCIPHSHDNDGNFDRLADDMIALEQDQVVSFVERDSPAALNSIPVAWIWRASRQEIINACCIKDNTPKPRGVFEVEAYSERQESKEQLSNLSNGSIASIAGCCGRNGPLG